VLLVLGRVGVVSIGITVANLAVAAVVNDLDALAASVSQGAFIASLLRSW